MPRPDRMYKVVWDRIKANKNNTVTLEVEPVLVARVKKAVIKEKNMDLAFKVMNDHDNFSLKIEYNKEKKQLHFKLHSSTLAIGMKGIEL